ncbi:MAG: aldo/keto reductase [Sporolactobacillus sp.]|nr:aldo/keto reductase [Sporolactobacillus sp.]MCI1881663.1 aldo/keto reductase [Sporolactobacillus sp.]
MHIAAHRLTDTYTLTNGVEIPVVGFGTWQSANGEEAYRAVSWALEAGYRHIDTAAEYLNEESVGNAIKDSGVPREELFVTTKLWNEQRRSYDASLQAFNDSLTRLGLDYVDLYLIHWPEPADAHDRWQKLNADSWRAMEKIYRDGRARAIGVSNFRENHLDELTKTQSIAPMVNQIFLNPGDQEKGLTAYNQAHHILTEAYSPLGTGQLLQLPELSEMARRHHKSVPQLLIRWSLEKGFLPLPKSVHKDYIEANTDVFDFELDDDDLAKLAAFDGKTAQHTDPQQFDYRHDLPFLD